MFFYDEQMFSVLMQFSLTAFSFMDCAFGAISEKASPCPSHLGFFPVLFSRSFLVCTLHLGLWCAWVHSCDGCKFCSRFIFCWWRGVQWFQHHLLKRLSLFCGVALLLCPRSVDCVYGGLFLGSLFCSIDLFVCSFPEPLRLHYFSILVSPEAG